MSQEEQVKQYMKKLGITEDEAIQLYLDDKDDFIGEDAEIMTAKAKEMKHMYISDKTKKKTQKERTYKENPDKQYIINAINKTLEHLVNNLVITNKEREIKFSYNDNNYTITLVQHRKAKEV